MQDSGPRGPEFDTPGVEHGGDTSGVVKASVVNGCGSCACLKKYMYFWDTIHLNLNNKNIFTWKIIQQLPPLCLLQKTPEIGRLDPQ